VKATEYDGKTWAVLWFTDAGMFYYRKDLLEKSGFSEPPETWDEMKRMADRIRTDSGTKFGYVFQGAQDEGGVVDGLEHVWNAGGDVLNGDEVIVTAPNRPRDSSSGSP
jgi:multiple sugar transport system substrate-binding protein